ncbi:MAG TPA: DUF1007 family protein [Selenomonadales bacterium]|nr:DUF1007 family protein [Selenomonadales bacterium]
MKIWILTFLFIVFISPPAQAHPHVFITPKATLVLNGHAVSQINVEWDFDDMSSALFFESCGSDSAAIWNLVFPENQLLVNGGQAPRIGYYTTVEIDGVPVANLTPAYFTANYVNGILRCQFTLYINRNVGNTMKIWFDDPTTYNAFDIQSGNFQFVDQSGASHGLQQQTEDNIDKMFLSW